MEIHHFELGGHSFHFTVLGILIATVFAVAMSNLLLWMFRVPRPITQAAAVARHAVGAIKTILVPTVGAAYSERGVELACRLGQEQKATIFLIYVIEVPRTSPLGVELPGAEERAREVLERAKSIVEQHGLEVNEHIERAREVGEGIVRAARDHEADLIVMGIRPSVNVSSRILGRTTDSVLDHAPCEVIIDKLIAQPAQVAGRRA